MDKKASEVDKKGMTMGKAILKLSAYVNSGMLTVHILKARQLFSKITHDCQPFVQVCLEPDPTGSTKCCTSIAVASPHPTFNEKFSFEMLLPGDNKRRLHITVWNNNGPGHTAEFLGAMSFGLNSVLAKQREISGWFYLLKEDIGKRKHLPALSRSNIYGDVGSPLQSPLEQTPTTHRKEFVADITIHSDINGNIPSMDLPSVGHTLTSDTTKIQSPGECNENPYVFSSAAQDGVATARKPLLSPKQVRFDMTQPKNGRPSVLPQTPLLYPDKSVLKSSIMKTTSQNPYVLQYRQEIASAERKFCDIHKMESAEPVKSLADVVVPQSVVDSPLQCQTQCCQTVTSCSVTSTCTSNVTATTVDTMSSMQSGNTHPKEIWIDCLSLESNNTTQDSGICDSSSPKSDDYGHKKFKNTSIDNNNDSKINDSTVYKESHLEPPSKSKVDISLKFPKDKTGEQFTNKTGGVISHEAYLHSGRARDDLQITRSKSAHDFKQGRSKLSSQSFNNTEKVAHYGDFNYPECECCSTRYYRQLYTPVLGDRRKFKKHNNEDLHTKVYFL